MALKKETLSKWLNITPQQLDILETILVLQEADKIASPKAITEQDHSSNEGPKIQKSNLFTQLKTLRTMGYIRSDGKASYAVDFDNIQKKLANVQRRIDAEAIEFKAAKNETEAYFKRLAKRNKTPTVEFINYENMYDEASKFLMLADSCYISGVFPRLLYANSTCLMNNSSAQRYSHALWERSIREGALNLHYISRFDMKYLFEHINEPYSNPELAYEECKIVLNNLENMIKKQNNVHFYYTNSSHIIDTIIPENNEKDILFLLIRDLDLKGMGALFIHSEEMASRFRSIHIQEAEDSIELKGEKGLKIVDMLRHQLI